MQKKYLTYIPRTLAIILIVSILAVTLSIVNNASPPTHSAPNEQTSGEQNNEQTKNQEEQNQEEQNQEEEPQIPDTYYTNFPKEATESVDYIFLQSVEGYGDIEIRNIHQTADYIYALIQTKSQFGDIQTDKDIVAIAMISPLGSIEKIMVLPSRLPLTFLSSALCLNGLVVMAKTEENILVFEVQTELNQSETTTLPLADSGRLYSSINGTLVLTEGAQNIVYKMGDKLKTGFLPPGEIVEFYDFYNYLLIFINTSSGYRVLRLTKNLSITQNTLMPSAKVLSVVPINEDEQMFVVVEKTSESVSLYKYDMTFNRQTALYTELGNITNIELLRYDNQIMAVITGDSNAIYSFNNELECSLSDLYAVQSVNELYQTWLYNEGIRILAKSDNSLALIDYRFDNSHTIYTIAESCNNARFVTRPNGNIIVFYDVLNEYNFYEIIIKAF